MKNSLFYPWQSYDAERIVKPLLKARRMLYPKKQVVTATHLPGKRINEFLPTAILLHGGEGIGKFRFALGLCQTLLCEVACDSYACGKCQSCIWFKGIRHPDFHLTFPENQLPLMCEEDFFEKNCLINAMPKSYPDTNSKEIKVDQARALSKFARISPQCSGLRIIMIYSVDRLNDVAANLLLKLVEEPPAYIIFVLVGRHPSIVLPTVVSRCLRIPLTYPDRNVVRNWLIHKKCLNVDEILAFTCGAPLSALKEARSFTSEYWYTPLLKQLSDGKNLNVQICMDSLSKVSLVDVVKILQRWIVDLMYKTMVYHNLDRKKTEMGINVTSNTMKRFQYFINYDESMSILAKKIDQFSLGKFYKKLIQVRLISETSLNVKLAIEHLLHIYISLFH